MKNLQTFEEFLNESYITESTIKDLRNSNSKEQSIDLMFSAMDSLKIDLDKISKHIKKKYGNVDWGFKNTYDTWGQMVCSVDPDKKSHSFNKDGDSWGSDTVLNFQFSYYQRKTPKDSLKFNASEDVAGGMQIYDSIENLSTKSIIRYIDNMK